MSSQPRIVVGVLAAVAVMAGFWFLLLAPKRTEISTANAAITQAETTRDAAVAAAAAAEQARGSYPQNYATVARLGKAVPEDDDIASLVYQLETIARANKIDFRAVKLIGAAAAPAPAPPLVADDKEANKDDKKDEKSEETAVPATPVAPVVAQPPPGAVVGPAGLLTVPFTFTFDGGYLKMQTFLKAINGLANSKKERITVRGRLLTVDGFSLAASRKGFPKVKAVVSATAYLVPESDAATAQAPAAGATTTALTTQDSQGAGR